MRLLLATRNQHKVTEFARLIGAEASAPGGGPDAGASPAAGAAAGPSAGLVVVALADGVELPPEDGETFAANALGKARAAALATGMATIADDSGIAAAALAGAPGVRSARFAGEHASDAENLARLLAEAPAGSAVEYVCAIAYVDPATGVERLFEGRCTGRLAAEPRGRGGFGYDPAFLPDEGPAGKTMAELDGAQKDAISHRGRAAAALLRWLSEGGADAPAAAHGPGGAKLRSG